MQQLQHAAFGSRNSSKCLELASSTASREPGRWCWTLARHACARSHMLRLTRGLRPPAMYGSGRRLFSKGSKFCFRMLYVLQWHQRQTCQPYRHGGCTARRVHQTFALETVPMSIAGPQGRLLNALSNFVVANHHVVKSLINLPKFHGLMPWKPAKNDHVCCRKSMTIIHLEGPDRFHATGSQMHLWCCWVQH